MPKYAARRTYRRRKAPYRPRRPTGGFQKSVARIAKRVVYRQREAKVACQTKSSTALTASWQLLETLNNTVAQGDGPSDRDGLAIRVSGIHLKLQLALAADRPQAMRLLIIKKKEDFVTTTDLPGTTVNPMIGCVQPHMRQKYTVLKDVLINPPPRLDDGSSPFRNVYRNFWIKQNSKLTYTGSAATDLDVGRIYVYAVADNLAGGTDFIDYASESIMHYKDM